MACCGTKSKESEEQAPAPVQREKYKWKSKQEIGFVDYAHYMPQATPVKGASEELDRELRAAKLEANRRKMCADLFHMMDLDGNGQIAKEELFLIGRKMGWRGAGAQEYSTETNNRIFAEMDTDKDGHVTEKDFENYQYSYLYQQAKYEDAEAKEKIKEFEATCKKIRDTIAKERQKRLQRTLRLKQVFSAWDLDGNGELTKDEFHKYMCIQSKNEKTNEVSPDGVHWSMHETNAMFKRYDTDGSGTITVDEFVNFYGEYWAFDYYQVTDEHFEEGIQKFLKGINKEIEVLKAEKHQERKEAEMADSEEKKKETEEKLEAAKSAGDEAAIAQAEKEIAQHASDKQKHEEAAKEAKATVHHLKETQKELIAEVGNVAIPSNEKSTIDMQHLAAHRHQKDLRNA